MDEKQQQKLERSLKSRNIGSEIPRGSGVYDRAIYIRS